MPRKDGTGPLGRQMHNLALENQNPELRCQGAHGTGGGRGAGRCDGTGRGGGRGMGRGAGRCLQTDESAVLSGENPVRHPETGTYGGGRGLHQHRNICNTKNQKNNHE